MKLQTQIPLQKQEHQIEYNSKLLLLGSCFAENIGEQFGYFKFQTLLNPFGILFHPKAIESLVVNAVNKKEYTEESVFFYNEQWHCYDAHSKLSDVSKQQLLQNLNSGLKATHNHILEASHIIITLGTAWVYDLAASNKVVANCHKVHQKQFRKKILSITEVSKSLQNIVRAIKTINKKVSIVFTVSPVRHIKNGFVENTLSKSHLIAGIHEVLNQDLINGDELLSYFPSYEIMLDELRDYRFYKIDMLHPNALAVSYIWEKFKTVWITEETQRIMEAVDAIQKGMIHKPFNPNSEAHFKFLQNLEERKHALQSKYSHFKF